MAKKNTPAPVPVNALQGTSFEKMKQVFVKLRIPHNDALVAENVEKMERNNAWTGEPDKYYNTPILRLAVYVDEEKARQGVAFLNKGLGDWVAICEIHKAHSQDYFFNPVTKRRMILLSFFVPQNLVPDYEGYIPTAAQLAKMNPNEAEPVKWGYLIYKKASAATKKKVKARL